MLLICCPRKQSKGRGVARVLSECDLSALQLQFGNLRIDYHEHQGVGNTTRSVLPDINHLGLVRHDRRISPDWIYSRDNELDHVRLVSNLESTETALPFHRIRA